MKEKSLGFVGGGRVTTCILSGLNRAGRLPSSVTVSDENRDILDRLKNRFPDIELAPADNGKAASKDIVFLALHPPVLKEGLDKIAGALGRRTVLISLAPKVSLAGLAEISGGVERIIRTIPNAPSFINEGFLPVAFSPAFTETEKDDWLAFFRVLGDSFEVPEEKLEAYAVITAMGPTFFWFQFLELQRLARSFGMTPEEAENAVYSMVSGTLNMLLDSGLSPREIMDLVPLKPLGEEEENIRNIYRTRLKGLYDKLKG